jgi:hypothetical protein
LKLTRLKRNVSRNWCRLWLRLQHRQPEPGALDSQIIIKLNPIGKCDSSLEEIGSDHGERLVIEDLC